MPIEIGSGKIRRDAGTIVSNEYSSKADVDVFAYKP